MTLMQDLLERRKNHRADKRAEEQGRKGAASALAAAPATAGVKRPGAPPKSPKAAIAPNKGDDDLRDIDAGDESGAGAVSKRAKRKEKKEAAAAAREAAASAAAADALLAGGPANAADDLAAMRAVLEAVADGSVERLTPTKKEKDAMTIVRLWTDAHRAAGRSSREAEACAFDWLKPPCGGGPGGTPCVRCDGKRTPPAGLVEAIVKKAKPELASTFSARRTA